jgi:hypothetical protein
MLECCSQGAHFTRSAGVFKSEFDVVKFNFCAISDVGPCPRTMKKKNKHNDAVTHFPNRSVLGPCHLDTNFLAQNDFKRNHFI